MKKLLRLDQKSSKAINYCRLKPRKPNHRPITRTTLNLKMNTIIYCTYNEICKARVPSLLYWTQNRSGPAVDFKRPEGCLSWTQEQRSAPSIGQVPSLWYNYSIINHKKHSWMYFVTHILTALTIFLNFPLFSLFLISLWSPSPVSWLNMMVKHLIYT
jgi:hypothetical protein